MSYDVGGMLEILLRLPGCFQHGVAMPLDEIRSPAATTAVVEDVLDLELFLLVDDVWWRSFHFDGGV